MREQFTSEDNKQTNKQTNKQNKRPYYRTLSSMYNVSDQNKTKKKNQSVAGHGSSMKTQINSSSGRHRAFSLWGKKEKRSALIATVNSKMVSSFPLETQADT